MRNAERGPEPITQWQLPPHPPEPVAEAYAKFAGLADKYDLIKDEVNAAQQEVTRAERKDSQRRAAAFIEGKEPKDSAEIATAEERLDGLLRNLAGLRQAVDEAGTAVAEAVHEHREEWAQTLEDREAQAAAELRESLTEALGAYAELRPARGAIGWLEDFDLDQARVGRVHNFAGGRLDVHGDRGSKYAGAHRPDDLIRLALRAADRKEVAA